MTKEEVIEILQKFGLPKNKAEYYANFEIEDKTFAWLPAFRFVRPLNRTLEFYKNEYGDLLKRRIEKGLPISQVEAELIEQGISSELIGKFAYEIALTSYNDVLYSLSDPTGSDYDLENEGRDLPSWTLMERDLNYEPTGRHLTETHSLIPFSNL